MAEADLETPEIGSSKTEVKTAAKAELKSEAKPEAPKVDGGSVTSGPRKLSSFRKAQTEAKAAEPTKAEDNGRGD